MKVLVTGANGLLGQRLVNLLIQNKRYVVIAVGKGSCRLPFAASQTYCYCSLDITDAISVNKILVEMKPDIIVHAAAMTQVDECELNPIDCWNVNVTATRFLLDAAKVIDAFFIYVSTDFVFDGEKGMYKEDDLLSPVNYYGSSKVSAEKSVIESRLRYAIVRTCLVYGNILNGTRNNIINWVRDNLQNNKSIKVVSDQWRTPTYVEDLAEGILLVIDKQAEGVFHISGKDLLTPYQMAIATASYFKLNTSLIEKVDASIFTQPAKRPAKTGFVIDKAIQMLGYNSISFEEGIKKMDDEKI